MTAIIKPIRDLLPPTEKTQDTPKNRLSYAGDLIKSAATNATEKDAISKATMMFDTKKLELSPSPLGGKVD